MLTLLCIEIIDFGAGCKVGSLTTGTALTNG